MLRGWVLAGGASRRFGRDKALVELEGLPLALHVARAMQAAGLEVGFVAKDDRLAHLGFPVLVEPQELRHPAVGVATALEQGAGVFAPCDVPFLPAEAFGMLGPGCVAFDGRVHPLVAHYPADFVEHAWAIANRNEAANKLADGCQRVTMPPHWLRNVNRPEDLSA